MTQVGGNHYQEAAVGIEPFDVIDHWSDNWPRGTDFYLGSALKYIARCGVKDDGAHAREDLLKAAHYLTEAAERTGGTSDVEGSGAAFGIEPESADSKMARKALQDVRVLTPPSAYMVVPFDLQELVHHMIQTRHFNPDARFIVREKLSALVDPEDVAVEWEAVRDSMDFTPEEEAAIDRRRRCLTEATTEVEAEMAEEEQMQDQWGRPVTTLPNGDMIDRDGNPVWADTEAPPADVRVFKSIQEYRDWLVTKEPPPSAWVREDPGVTESAWRSFWARHRGN